MNSYFDLLVQKLYEKIDGPEKGKVNIVRWFNFTTFDLIGDLCFGESFDALKTEEYVYSKLCLFSSESPGSLNHYYLVIFGTYKFQFT
jgi:hypothetical protein